MTDSLCNLCKTNIADKRNSHIVPKFMTMGLFPLDPPRKILVIDKNGSFEMPQGTPKEDYILCTDCEKRIEVVETIFARKIRDIHSYKNLPREFNHIISGQREYVECKDINPTLFKLFF